MNECYWKDKFWPAYSKKELKEVYGLTKKYIDMLGEPNQIEHNITDWGKPYEIHLYRRVRVETFIRKHWAALPERIKIKCPGYELEKLLYEDAQKEQ